MREKREQERAGESRCLPKSPISPTKSPISPTKSPMSGRLNPYCNAFVLLIFAEAISDAFLPQGGCQPGCMVYGVGFIVSTRVLSF